MGSGDVDARTNTHCLEAGTYDDDEDDDFVEKNARMRLKRGSGWSCSWIWNDSTTGDDLRVTMSN